MASTPPSAPSIKAGGGKGAKKPCLVEDLQAAADELVAQVGTSTTQLSERIAEVDTRLSSELNRLSIAVERLEATSKRLEDASAKQTDGASGGDFRGAVAGPELDERLKRLEETLRMEVERWSTHSEEHGKQMEQLHAKHGDVREKHSFLSAALSEAQERMGSWSQKLTGFDHLHKQVREDISTRVSNEDLRKELARIEDHFTGFETRATQRENRLEGRLEALKSDFTHQAHVLNDWQKELASTTQDSLSTMKTELRTSTSATRDLVSSIKATVGEAAGCATRKVEWSITEAAIESAFRNADEGNAIITSGKFDAAGSSGLWLELTIGTGRDFQEGGARRGEIEIGLCGPSGLFLVCRLLVGKTAVQRRHTFDGHNLCWSGSVGLLEDLVSDGSLMVGVEILEGIQQVTRVPVPGDLSPASPRAVSPGASSPQEKMDKRRSRKMSASLSSGTGVTVSMSASGSTEDLTRKEGTMTFHRYLNHRTLDLVRDQVELMRSRMVRRVEWDIQQASLLQQCFPPGEAVCSTSFEAAGIEGLQLVFYPSGFSGARNGYCSFFVRIPAGSSLHCNLWVGKQKRSAKLEMEEQGYFGRTNFCHFEQCMDWQDDAIRLALEIDDAEQSVTELLSHRTSPTRPPASARQERPEKFGSSLRLKRAAGKGSLEDVRTLPSIWTPQPLSSVVEALEGFRPFSDLKAHGSSRPTTSNGSFGQPGSARSSRHHRSVETSADISVSLVDSKYSMYHRPQPTRRERGTATGRGML
jgi:hypothetical protein